MERRTYLVSSSQQPHQSQSTNNSSNNTSSQQSQYRATNSFIPTTSSHHGHSHHSHHHQQQQQQMSSSSTHPHPHHHPHSNNNTMNKQQLASYYGTMGSTHSVAATAAAQSGISRMGSGSAAVVDPVSYNSSNYHTSQQQQQRTLTKAYSTSHSQHHQQSSSAQQSHYGVTGQTTMGNASNNNNTTSNSSNINHHSHHQSTTHYGNMCSSSAVELSNIMTNGASHGVHANHHMLLSYKNSNGNTIGSGNSARSQVPVVHQHHHLQQQQQYAVSPPTRTAEHHHPPPPPPPSSHHQQSMYHQQMQVPNYLPQPPPPQQPPPPHQLTNGHHHSNYNPNSTAPPSVALLAQTYCTPETDGLPLTLVESMRTLFDILDDNKQGKIRLSDIESRWEIDSNGQPTTTNGKGSGAEPLIKMGVLGYLRKVTPSDGMLTFDRFCAGLRLALLTNNENDEGGFLPSSMAAFHKQQQQQHQSSNSLQQQIGLPTIPPPPQPHQFQQHQTFQQQVRNLASKSSLPILQNGNQPSAAPCNNINNNNNNNNNNSNVNNNNSNTNSSLMSPPPQGNNSMQRMSKIPSLSASRLPMPSGPGIGGGGANNNSSSIPTSPKSRIAAFSPPTAHRANPTGTSGSSNSSNNPSSAENSPGGINTLSSSTYPAKSVLKSSISMGATNNTSGGGGGGVSHGDVGRAEQGTTIALVHQQPPPNPKPGASAIPGGTLKKQTSAPGLHSRYQQKNSSMDDLNGEFITTGNNNGPGHGNHSSAHSGHQHHHHHQQQQQQQQQHYSSHRNENRPPSAPLLDTDTEENGVDNRVHHHHAHHNQQQSHLQQQLLQQQRHVSSQHQQQHHHQDPYSTGRSSKYHHHSRERAKSQDRERVDPGKEDAQGMNGNGGGSKKVSIVTPRHRTLSMPQLQLNKLIKSKSSSAVVNFEETGGGFPGEKGSSGGDNNGSSTTVAVAQSNGHNHSHQGSRIGMLKGNTLSGSSSTSKLPGGGNKNGIGSGGSSSSLLKYAHERNGNPSGASNDAVNSSKDDLINSVPLDTSAGLEGVIMKGDKELPPPPPKPPRNNGPGPGGASAPVTISTTLITNAVIHQEPPLSGSSQGSGHTQTTASTMTLSSGGAGSTGTGGGGGKLSEIRNALQSWQKGILSTDKKPVEPTLSSISVATTNSSINTNVPSKSGREPGSVTTAVNNSDATGTSNKKNAEGISTNDGNATVAVNNARNAATSQLNAGTTGTEVKLRSGGSKSNAKRRETPRRHTVQTGIDFATLKRLKQLEQERDVLKQGMAFLEKAQQWYVKQLETAEDRISLLSKGAPITDYWSESHEERLNLLGCRVSEVNSLLSALMDGSSQLPVHMNLQIPSHLSLRTMTRLKDQNRQLTQEVSDCSHRITQLETEKAMLLRQLFHQKNSAQSDETVYM